MTPLRTRMIEDMKLAGLAAKTQEVYLQAVSALAKHYKKSPELLTEEEVRRYLLDARERNARGSFKTLSRACCALGPSTPASISYAGWSRRAGGRSRCIRVAVVASSP